jgi:hypothetical protein
MGPFRNGKGVVAACSISGTHAPQCSLSPCRVSRHATNAIPRLLNTRELMEKRLMVANMGGGGASTVGVYVSLLVSRDGSTDSFS